MGRSAAAVVAAILSIPATAAIVGTEAGRIAPPAILPDAPPPAQSSTTERPACVWRIAFRPPARLYYGCQWPDTLATSTYWVDLGSEQISALAALAAAISSSTAHGPVTLPSPAGAQEISTQCDRYWLWAADEGPRAPQMTREHKIAQACADGAGEGAPRGN